mmetsp:Transcript_13157/g.35131  ORF Transcript_13157/g.35131 Transcript_13157/m.35131 type:complete len:202 (-) Transcript_13157:492-1097(-)
MPPSGPSPRPPSAVSGEGPEMRTSPAMRTASPSKAASGAPSASAAPRSASSPRVTASRVKPARDFGASGGAASSCLEPASAHWPRAHSTCTCTLRSTQKPAIPTSTVASMTSWTAVPLVTWEMTADTSSTGARASVAGPTSISERPGGSRACLAPPRTEDVMATLVCARVLVAPTRRAAMSRCPVCTAKLSGLCTRALTRY